MYNSCRLYFLCAISRIIVQKKDNDFNIMRERFLIHIYYICKIYVTIESIASITSSAGDLERSTLQSILPQFDTKLPTRGHYDEYDASNNLDLYPTVSAAKGSRAEDRTRGTEKLRAQTGYFSGWLAWIDCHIILHIR